MVDPGPSIKRCHAGFVMDIGRMMMGKKSRFPNSENVV